LYWILPSVWRSQFTLVGLDEFPEEVDAADGRDRLLACQPKRDGVENPFDDEYLVVFLVGLPLGLPALASVPHTVAESGLITLIRHD